MISTVESLPTVSGQDGSATNSLKAQEDSGFGGNRKPFGDILSSQESSVEGTQSASIEEDLTQGGGKELLSGGKDLPDADAEPIAASVPVMVSNTDELAKAVAQQNLVVSQVNDSSTAVKGGMSNIAAHESNVAPVAGTIASLLSNKEPQGSTSPLPDSSSLGNGGIAGGEGRAAKTLVPSILNGTGVNNTGAEPAKALQAVNNGVQATQFLQPGLLNEADVVADSPSVLLGKESSIFEAIDRLGGIDAPLKSALSQASPLASNTVVAQTTSSELPSGLKATPTTLSMTSSLGEPGWDGEFVGRVNMVVKGGLQEARIQLSPPELGRLDIKVSTEGETTKVMFAVDSVAAREAIEQAMPRLRELLEQGGLQLSHAEVSDHSQSRQRQGEVAEGLTLEDTPLDAEIDDGEGANSWQLGVSTSTSTVDYYI